MSERIDEIKVDLTDLTNSIFINGPADFLITTICDELKKVEQFSRIFGEYIDPYKRMDYPIRAFPALRVYNNVVNKEFESWWLEGDVLADVIWPASMRRNELQMIPDVVSSALLQQFRRTPFFNLLSAKVPGLNEMGKRFNVDKSLGFMTDDDEEIAPLTQLRINFRIDLRQWDDYLERSNRTTEDPFEVTLGNLERLVTTIEALRNTEDDLPELTVKGDQETKA